VIPREGVERYDDLAYALALAVSVIPREGVERPM
jgi:hypothetical protein